MVRPQASSVIFCALRPVFALGLGLLLAVPTVTRAAAQQDQASQPFTITATARERILDVVVTDKAGRVVTNLKQGDFTIYDDGTAQKIKSFAAPESHLMPASAGVVVRTTADLAKIGTAPVTILVMDELNTTFEDNAYARLRIEKYLQAQQPVMAQPTELLAAGNSKFEVISDFTQDRAAILNALHKHFPDFPTKATRGGAGGSNAFERMAQSLNSLNQMAEATRGTPGRKTVIWVGKGFPAVDLLSLDDNSTDMLQAAIQRLTDALLQSRITLYTVDPESNLTAGAQLSDVDDLQDYETQSDGTPFKDTISFSTLAPATGGKAFFSRNDIDAEVAESTAQGANYYTMSYTPSTPPADDSKYHQIRIKMNDPNLVAVTRDGYYPNPGANLGAKAAAPDPAKMTPKEARSELEAEMGKAALSTIVYNGLTVSVARGAGGSVRVGVTASSLKWMDETSGKLRAEITVLAVPFTKKGKALKPFSTELSAEVASRIKNPDQQAFWVVPVQIPPDATRIRVVVRDANSGSIGTAEMTP